MNTRCIQKRETSRIS